MPTITPHTPPSPPQVLLDSLLSLQPRSVGAGGGVSREDLVMTIATDLLEQVPQPFNLEVRREKGTGGEKGRGDGRNVCDSRGMGMGRGRSGRKEKGAGDVMETRLHAPPCQPGFRRRHCAKQNTAQA